MNDITKEFSKAKEQEQYVVIDTEQKRIYNGSRRWENISTGKYKVYRKIGHAKNAIHLILPLYVYEDKKPKKDDCPFSIYKIENNELKFVIKPKFKLRKSYDFSKKPIYYLKLVFDN